MRNLFSRIHIVFILFVLLSFCTKSGFAQTTLLPGDLAIVGINNKGTSANLAVVALRNIEANTIIKFTDKGWLGATKALTASAADGTITLTTGVIAAGTVFNFTVLGGPVPSVSVSPNVGSIAMDAGWSAPTIAGNAGDAWLIYTGNETSPSFIYGLANWSTLNPFGYPPDEYGWVSAGTTSSSTVSYLPNALKIGNFHGNLAGNNFKIYSSYSSTFTGTRASILAAINNQTNWTKSDTDFKDLTPGTTGGAFPNVQPIFKIPSVVVPPSVTASPSVSAICSGRSTGIALSSSSVGAVFNWTVSLVSGTVNGASAGSGSSIAQNLSGNGTINYIVTPMLNGVTGSPITVTVTVSPLPVASATPSSATITTGNSTNIALTSVPFGATFFWTESIASGTVNGAAVGSGNLIAQQLTGNGVVNYTVTPILNGCQGDPITVSVTVKPNLPAPTVLSIVRKTPTTALTNAASVEFTITFSEAVTGVDLTDMILSSTGSISGASISSLAGSGTTYTAIVNTGIGDGTIKLGLASSGTGITNSIGNPIQSGYSAGEVYTIDNTEPILTSVSIKSNRAGNGNIAIPGDIITLSFTSSERITIPVVSINGNTAVVENSISNIWVATYTTLATDNNGPIPFSISYSDLAGNAGTSRTTTTDATVVTFDKTVPTLSPVTIASNNISYPAYAKVGALLTLMFTASESIPSPTVTIGGATVTAFPAGGFNWMAMYVIPPYMTEGEVPFSISFRDTFGNVGIPVTIVSTGSMVTLDKTTPTLSNVSISSDNPNPALAKAGDELTITFNASESIATPIVTLFGNITANVTAQASNVWTATYVLGPVDPEGPVTFSISYSDFAGNAGLAVTTTNDASSVTYDRTVPVAPNLGVMPGDKQNTMTWYLNADYATYELIGGASGELGNNVLTTVTAANATNSMTYTQTGLTNFIRYYYALRVTDAAGNINTSNEASGRPINDQTITFDQPEPAEYGSSFTINATSSSGLPVTLTSMDPTLATISGNTVTIIGANIMQSVSILATQSGNLNYTFAPLVVRQVQIKPKPVTVTATAQSKVFNDPEPALAAPTITPALFGADVSTGELKRETGENAGNYEIQQNTFSLDPNKYAITYDPANFTINPITVTINPIRNTKVYNHNDPTLSFFIDVAGVPVTGALKRTSGENVGSYNYDISSMTVAANYQLALNPTPKFAITPLTVNVTPSAGNKQYGDNEPELAFTHVPTLRSGDNFSGSLTRVQGETPGNYVLSQGTLALTSNYILDFSPTPVNFVVLKKNIIITPFAGQGKVYGDVDGTINYETSPALLNGDILTGNLTRTVGSDVGNYAITNQTLKISNPLNVANYDLQIANETYAIRKKLITVTANVGSKPYGGAEPAIFTYVADPLLAGNSFTGRLERVAGEASGDYAIEQGTLNIPSGNYDINYVEANFTVENQQITITPKPALAKVYNEADPIFEYDVSPIIPGVNLSGSLARTNGEDVGSYDFNLGTLTAGSTYKLVINPTPKFSITRKTITVVPVAVQKMYGDPVVSPTYTYSPNLKPGDVFTGNITTPTITDGFPSFGKHLFNVGTLALSNNYNLVFAPGTLSYNVISKPIKIIPNANQGKVYGEADQTINYDITPALVNNDQIMGKLSRAAGSDVGTYKINLGTLNTGVIANYTLEVQGQDYTITQKAITITAESTSKTYGNADPAFNYTSSVALISPDAFTGALGRVPGTNVGSYNLTMGTLKVNDNYVLTLAPGSKLVINSKAIDVVAKVKTRVYGDEDPTLDYDVIPELQPGDVFTGTLSRAEGENVNTYAIGQGDLALNANYILNYTDANLTITAKPIAIQAVEKSKTYGDEDPELTYTTIPSLINGDVFTGTLVRLDGENKGTYPIVKGSLAASNNYMLTFNGADFNIDAAPLTITAEAKEKFVGTENPLFTPQYSGFVNDENASVLTSPVVFNTTATINSSIGTYDVFPSGAVANNYEIKFVKGVLTVKAGAPTNVLFVRATLYENQVLGTPAGQLSSTSDDPNATFTYSLVSGNGDTDNDLFRINGDQLVTNASLDYENKKVYSVNVKSTTQHGFALDKVFTISLNDVNEIPTLDIIANKTICYTTSSQSIDLTGISVGPDAGQEASISLTGSNPALLQSLTVSAVSGGNAKISYRVKNGASGTSTITVTVQDDGGSENGGVDTYSRTFVLTVNTLPIVAISADKGSNNSSNSTAVSKGETVVLTASGGNSYEWIQNSSVISGQTTANLSVRPKETTTYTVTVTNTNGCSEQKSFTVNVLDDMEKIKAQNILTPNGDGYNDKWIIENIDFYPNNEVKVFDKAGRVVYTKKVYDNSWDGTYNGVALAEGTYYYIIDFGTGKRVLKGFITVVREN